jgi:hypothetical protein
MIDNIDVSDNPMISSKSIETDISNVYGISGMDIVDVMEYSIPTEKYDPIQGFITPSQDNTDGSESINDVISINDVERINDDESSVGLEDDNIIISQTDHTDILHHDAHFTEIINKKTRIITLIENMNLQIDDMELHHKRYQPIKPKDIYIHALDSIYFQSRLCRLEFTNIQLIFRMVNNKMYCEYYKLYCNMTETDNTLPSYDDVDEEKEYSNDDICNVYELIHVEIKKLIDIVNQKTCDISKCDKDNMLE